jgi:hypothetical protein
MIVETIMTKKDYRNLMLLITYSRPMTIFITIIAVFSFVPSILYLLGAKLPFNNPPYAQMIFGVVIIFILPFMIVRGANKAYESHLRLQEKMIYDFTQEGIKITGESFKSEMNWTKVYKVKERKNWILIYQSQQVANIIKKESLGDNLIEFRELVKKQGIKSSLKK